MPDTDAELAELITLLKLAVQVSRPMTEEVGGSEGLLLNELKVLMTLWGEGELAAHELVDWTGLNPMSISRAVATLVRAGYAREASDPANRRRKLVRLTPEGRACYDRLKPRMERTAAVLFASLTPVERRVGARFVAKLLAQLQAWPRLRD